MHDDLIKVAGCDKNVGLTKGLNFAIRSCECEYTAIVGSGDICKQSRLNRQVEELDSHPDAVFCDLATICEDEVSGKLFYDESFDEKLVKRGDIESRCPLLMDL